MKRILLVVLFFGIGLSSFSATFAGEAAPWSTSLSFDGGGGVWTKRMPITFHNRFAEPMEGKVHTINHVNLHAATAQEIRVTTETGQEVMFDLHRDGERLETGPLGKGAPLSILSIPVDCEPGKSAQHGKARYFVYFGNPKAEPVPEFLDAKPGFANGDMETGPGPMPSGWEANPDKSGYRNLWTDEKSKSGKKCMKTVIEPGNQAEWFAVRQSGIPVYGGLKYRVSGWVRGEDVKGRAGWFIHVGNEKNSQMINNVQGNFEGTFDWKEIVFEFTAPKDADRLTIGTVLYGTGTAWFDDVKFEMIDEKELDERFAMPDFGEVESIPYKIVELESGWPTMKDDDYLCRSTFRIVNDSDTDLTETPAFLTLRGTLSHGLRGPLTEMFLLEGRAVFDEKRIPVTMLDEENNRVVVPVSVPAKTIKYFNVYYKFDESKAPKGIVTTTLNSDRNMEADTAHPELQATVDPFADIPNLVKNGDFEAEPTADGFPLNWNRNDRTNSDGVTYSLETDPKNLRFGQRCAKLDVSENAPKSWRGWTQRVEIEPGKSYLVQGWLKTANHSGTRIHLHFHDAQGAHTKDGAMSSIGPDVSGDWKRLAEVVTPPTDARFMTVHLTTNASGTIWCDNISVFDGLFAEQVGRGSCENCQGQDWFFWQVPAIAKVFPETVPPIHYWKTLWDIQNHGECFHRFRIEAARNEKEPMQIAVRDTAYGEPLEFRIEPPTNESGFVLDDFEINRVGYVSIDYPSNYYNTKVPKWYRKTPTSAPGCDGWKGLWPDPLLPPDPKLPKNTVDLNCEPDRTQSFWITWKIPKNAPAGVYKGTWHVDHSPRGYYSVLSSVDDDVLSGEIEITVRDFTLPDETHVTAMYDVRFGRGGDKYWGRPMREMYPEIVEFMSENRIAPDKIGVDPKVEFKDGKFHFDWTEYDKMCEWYFNERKIRFSYTPHLLYCFGWGHPPKDFFGEKPYEGVWPFTGADFTKLRPEYRAKYQGYLREFWNHVKEKGWADRFILYISDEPNYWQGSHIIDQMKAVCDMIHEVDKDIPIYCSTWHHIPDWDQSLDVWGIGHYGIVPVETMEHIKKIGSKIWFTTDGMLCLDTPYSAIERLLPYYCYKYGADAYEFWGVAWLTWDPYRRGDHAYIHQSSTPGEYYWVRYPNGDGYLVYPPPPDKPGKIVESVRFAQAREGVEDFEYFYLLTNLIEQAKKSGKDTLKAEAALAAVKEMIDCPSPIGRYSSKILPNPNKLYEVRRQVADAIESFNK